MPIQALFYQLTTLARKCGPGGFMDIVSCALDRLLGEIVAARDSRAPRAQQTVATILHHVSMISARDQVIPDTVYNIQYTVFSV